MSRMTPGMYSSKSSEWATPQPFFDLLQREFRFTLDAAADSRNAKCAAYYTKEDDGLTQPWTGTVWCNPPYGREIGRWVQKGYESAQAGAVVVMFIPARTDTGYWHDFVFKADEVRLVRGRMQFVSERAISNAPFPSALVIFRPGWHVAKFSSMERGAHEQPRRSAA